MRQIKLRAWDKDQNRMRTDVVFDNDGRAWVWNNFVGGYSTSMNEHNFTRVQFTGLFDKTGNEIWEGDIFQCTSGDKKKMMQGEIYFADGCFEMKYGYANPKKEDRSDYFLSGSIRANGAEQLEIIGNIYQNPELIK